MIDNPMPNDLETCIKTYASRFKGDPTTLGELIEIAVQAEAPLSHMAVAEAVVRESKPIVTILDEALHAFDHNLRALEVGLTWGRSFLLGTVGSDLAGCDGAVVTGDPFLDRTITYTLATEVGNHEIGLQPCAGTGDSCPYTGLLKALSEEDSDPRRLGFTAALLLKVGSIFRAGKKTTGCNMEGYGAGAAAVAAALTDWRGGSADQAGRALCWPCHPLSPCLALPG